jgi:hypothetical protein
MFFWDRDQQWSGLLGGYTVPCMVSLLASLFLGWYPALINQGLPSTLQTMRQVAGLICLP